MCRPKTWYKQTPTSFLKFVVRFLPNTRGSRTAPSVFVRGPSQPNVKINEADIGLKSSMGYGSALDAFLNSHKNQLVHSGVPEHLWETLYKKLITQTFDAGKSFQLVKLEYEEKRKESEPVWALQAIATLEISNPENIYLIDHAWTFKVNRAKTDLMQYDNLRFRLANMLDILLDSTVEQIDKIFESMWRINNTYSVRSAESVEEQLPIWYIMDEIGCAVTHSDTPNVRIVPFVYVNEQITYSLLFPIRDIDEEDIIYRDFVEGIKDPTVRSAALLPWIPTSFKDSIHSEIPGPEYYLNGHIRESLPKVSNFSNISNLRKHEYKVFSQYSLVTLSLNNPLFKLVENREEADILWLIEHFKNFENLSETPEKFINQFPFEYVITVKDLLCITCKRYKNNSELPEWLPQTYNLVTEIGNFVSCFQKREQDALDNHWIIKPYNLARGMDIHITNNLNYIMRLPATGPKIVQKYITNPVLFYRPECEGKVKFDIRYVILLKRVQPLEAYVYKEFFLRFANKPFQLNNFDDYEKHFTVMNYNENVTLKHMKCADFKAEWAKQYDNYEWQMVEEKILRMIKEILECATSAPPPCGIAESPQSRAMYAADLMLEFQKDTIIPKILEINFMPDCKRACDYYTDFFNDIFKLLFVGEEPDVFYKL